MNHSNDGWYTTSPPGSATSAHFSSGPARPVVFNGGSIPISRAPPGSFVGQILTGSYTTSSGGVITYNGTRVVNHKERSNVAPYPGRAQGTSRARSASVARQSSVTVTTTTTTTTTYTCYNIPLDHAPPGCVMGQRLDGEFWCCEPGQRVVFNSCIVVEPSWHARQLAHEAQNQQQQQLVGSSTFGFESSGRGRSGYNPHTFVNDDAVARRSDGPSGAGWNYAECSEVKNDEKKEEEEDDEEKDVPQD